MKEEKKFNEKLNIRVPYKILTNSKLSENEKLILSLDYTFSLKKGSNKMTNVDVGKLFSLHPNIVGICRKSLITKGFLQKDKVDKLIYLLTDIFDSLENSMIDNTECIIPFEIYNHLHLKTGAKLLWGEYNTMSKTEKGYFKKRDTTSKLMNVSVGSITNWTKELFSFGFLEEYEIISGYHKKQKIVKTVEFKRENNIDEYELIGELFENSKVKQLKEVSKKLNLPKEEKIKKDIVKSKSNKEDEIIYSPLFPVNNVSDLHNDSININNYDNFIDD
ncbi:hypothetical protein BWK59_12195 [Flavobacterium davisii]|uniref:Uncharacterized protein n=1 Tax=Flavobacterium davisii TaxID=2906077 RepID=A0A2D0AIG1_9FLAO|nr:hypothetical protein [Flavobacterium davisii]OWP83130.1 hypothetical protein BWK59_12195 [Flavobacterium davisii]